MTEKLHEVVTSITQKPRAALNAVEEKIGGLRDLMNQREALLFSAIDQHDELAEHAVKAVDLIARALEDIHGKFEQAMRPTPALEDASAQPLRAAE